MEGQARRLIDFAGLDWNDAGLDFHKPLRSIRTASTTQYVSRNGSRHHYEKYLGPLLEGLGEFAARS